MDAPERQGIRVLNECVSVASRKLAMSISVEPSHKFRLGDAAIRDPL